MAMTQANPRPKTMRVMVDKPFFVPVFEMQGDVPVKTGMRVTEIDEVVILDTDLALDAIAGNKARAVSLKEDEATKQLSELAARKKTRQAAAAAAKAEAERLAKITPESQIAAAVTLGVQMAIEKLGLAAPAKASA